jgi:hypothetical protein
MLGWIKDKGDEVRRRVLTRVSKVENASFSEAIGASCTLSRRGEWGYLFNAAQYGGFA